MILDKQVTNAGGFDVYALGTASAGVAGSSLVLCFAYTSNYVFEVGTLTLHGPTAEDFTCPMTDACSIQLSGTGLANTNKVKVQGSSTTCYGERIHLQLLFKLAVTDTTDMTFLLFNHSSTQYSFGCPKFAV